MMAHMIVVHHLNNSRSQRVLWMLEELGLAYEVKRYERDRKTMLAPEELALVHPLGKSPVITDEGVTIAESGAILEYLAERYGKGALAPAAGTADKRQFNYWMHYAEGSLMPLLLLKLVFARVEKGPMPFFVKPVAKGICGSVNKQFIAPRLSQHLNFVEAELAKMPWFSGAEFGAADIQMSFPLEAAAARSGVDTMPHIGKFLERIHARPAYKRALERGGAYEILEA